MADSGVSAGQIAGQLPLPFEELSSDALVDRMADRLVELFDPEELWDRVAGEKRG